MAEYHGPGGGPGWPLRSMSCLAGTHAECGHLGAMTYGRRDAGRPSLVLCQCGCHSACPLAGWSLVVSRAIWEGLCTCAGTELAAVKLDGARRDAPDFDEFKRTWRERREKSARESDKRVAGRREAFEAARAASAGKSGEQIRELYVAELRARGLTVPSDIVLDATADAIAGNRDKFSMIYSVRVLAELGRDLRKLVSGFRPSSGGS
jgi:hypothetical protein